MGSHRIDININGKDNAKAAYNSAANGIKKLATDTASSSSKIKSSLSGTQSAVNGLKGAFSGLGGVMGSALSGLSLAEMVTSAGAAESKWNRISVNAGLTGTALADMKSSSRELAMHYGVVNGEASKTLESMIRFEGYSGQTMKNYEGILATSKLTNKSTDEIYSAIQSGELGRNKSLQKNVLSEDQRLKYLDDNVLTQEEINQILQENTGIVANNNELINDAESSWNRMMNEVTKVSNTIGTSMLPVVTTMGQVIGGVAEGFGTINTATGGVLGAATGTVLALIAMGAPLVFAVSQAKKLLEYMTGSAIASKGVTPTVVGPTTPITASTVGLGALTTAAGWQVLAAGARASTGAVLALGTLGTLALMGLDRALQGTSHYLQNLFVMPPAAKDLIDFIVTLPGKLTFGSENVGKGPFSWLETLNVGPLGTVIYLTQSLNNAIVKSYEATKPLLVAFASAWNTGGLQGVTNALQRIICALLGCSPGIVPALEKVRDTFNSVFNGVRGVVMGAANYIKSVFINAVNTVVNKWNGFKGLVNQGVRGAVSVATGAINAAVGTYNWARGNIGRWIGTGVSVAAGAIQWAINKWNELRSVVSRTISGTISVVYSILGGKGPRGPASIGMARGPFDNLSFNYENYAGHKEGRPSLDGNCLTGNCMDLSLGMMALNGGRGSLVNSTWSDGGPHMYYKDPMGIKYDGTSKSLYGTFNPPRGPGNGGGYNINIYGDVYGIEDFNNKVEQGLNKITRNVHYY